MARRQQREYRQRPPEIYAVPEPVQVGQEPAPETGLASRMTHEVDNENAIPA